MLLTAIKALDNGEYQIVKTNSTDGKIKDAVTIVAVEAQDEKTIGRLLMENVKKDGTYRAAHQSLLGMVLASPRMDGFRGTGDKVTGKTSKEFKAAVRDAETNTIEEMVKTGSIRLAKSDNVQLALQEFLSCLRDNKNYSNIKSYCSQYYAICGHLPVTKSGRLVPQPVMVEEIKAAIHKEPVDKSIAGRLQGVIDALKGVTIDAEDAIKSLARAQELVAQLSPIVDDYAEKATVVRGNIAAAAKAVIASAGAVKAGSVKSEPYAEPALM